MINWWIFRDWTFFRLYTMTSRFLGGILIETLMEAHLGSFDFDNIWHTFYITIFCCFTPRPLFNDNVIIPYFSDPDFRSVTFEKMYLGSTWIWRSARSELGFLLKKIVESFGIIDFGISNSALIENSPGGGALFAIQGIIVSLWPSMTYQFPFCTKRCNSQLDLFNLL